MSAYITRANLEALALPPGAVGSLLDADVEAIIVRASAEADARLRARYTLPLLTWGDDLSGWVADIAGLLVLRKIGTNPESADYERFKDAHDLALSSLDKVAKRVLHPAITDSAKLTRVPRASSQTRRGF